MKKIRFFLYMLLAGLLFFSACEKDVVTPFTSVDSAKKSANADRPNVVLVTPQGPDFDTQNLLDAFEEAKEIGPGATVMLGEGTFYLEKTDIHDFYGKFKGLGTDKTKIETVPGGITLPVTSPFIETDPFFITFHGGDFSVSDITFEITEDQPCEPYDWPSSDPVTFLGGVVRVAGSSPDNFVANASFENVVVKGKYVDIHGFTPYNIDNGIIFGGGYKNPPLEGQFVVKNSEFYGTETSVQSVGLVNASLIIGGGKNNGNYMKNVNAAVGAVGYNNSTAIISFNKMEDVRNYAGFYFIQGFPNEFAEYINSKSIVKFHHNEMEVNSDPGYLGVAVYSYDLVGFDNPDEASEIYVNNNVFKLIGPEMVVNYGFSHNTMVISNSVIGNGICAFYVSGMSNNWFIGNNDISDFEPLWTDIYLGPYTENNNVVCEQGTTIILDYGTNNEIKGPYIKGYNKPEHENGFKKKLKLRI